MSASFLDAMNTRAEDTAEYFDADELCEECTDDNRCEECTHCARTKVCPDCDRVGGCEWYCINVYDELCERLTAEYEATKDHRNSVSDDLEYYFEVSL